MPGEKFSKTQIDKLGERLKAGTETQDDLRMLDEYCRSFAPAHESVIRTIRQIGEIPTSRRAKSNASIVAKLRRGSSRGSTRLSRMQDVAGCRVVVSGIIEQERIVESLSMTFQRVNIVDRRSQPSHGYRAIHVIAEISGRPVEIQIRTSLQHMWAELSERISDALDPAIKYGGGPEIWRNFLLLTSDWVADFERLEMKYGAIVLSGEESPTATVVDDYSEMQESQRWIEHMRNEIMDFLREPFPEWPDEGCKGDDFPN